MKKALILFSGGKGSLLATLLLIENGFTVYLVTYQNGYETNSKSAISTGERLIEMYGDEKVKIIGVNNISPIWQEIVYDYYKLNPSEIIKNYGDVPCAYFNCLSCKLSMYIKTIEICKQMGINYVVDGTRKNKILAMKQESLLNEFTMLFKQHEIDLSFPLIDLNDDLELITKILERGFIPKTSQPHCSIKIPIPLENVNDKFDEDLSSLYTRKLKPITHKIIDKSEQENSFYA